LTRLALSTDPPHSSGEFRPPQWRALLDAAPVGVCLVDPVDGLIIDLNDPLARMLEQPRAALLGRRCQDLIHPDDAQVDARSLSALLRGVVASVDRVKRWRRADGSFVAARSRVRLGELPGQGRPVLWVWSEEAEDAPASPPLAPAAALPAAGSAPPVTADAGNAPNLANPVESAFLGNISHEIRTPLAVICGLADLLRREAGDARSRRRLNQLFDTTQHLLGVVDDILELSSLQTGELDLRLAPFRLGAVMDRVQRLHAGQAREKGLSFTIDADAALRSLRLHGDEMRLSQVLTKLCGNAVKFTERGNVGVSVQALRQEEAGAHLRFTVSDTGPGVPLELRARLFRPFVQGDASSARRFGGTGLGLAFVHRLVTLMDGSILLRSEPGQGSSFEVEVWLPRAEPAAADVDAGPEPEGPVDLSGVHVLLAEDHPLSQEILCDLLESLGCEVVIAADGPEALELFEAGGQDLVLMDMQMPGMDGLEATRRIRALPSGREIPIIGLTANVSGDDRQRCLKAGMNEHLGKPIGQAQLAQAIARWLSPGRLAGAGRVRPAAEPAAVGAPSTDAHLMAAMAALPGLRIDASWRDSTHRLQSYQGLLLRFVQTQALEAVLLREHLEAGRFDAARQTAHALTGAAGMVGARAVMDLARAVEQGARQGRALQDLLDQARQCLAEISRLAAALESLPQPSSAHA
jgi:two-component system sensor histidine kinase/response regulator